MDFDRRESFVRMQKKCVLGVLVCGLLLPGFAAAQQSPDAARLLERVRAAVDEAVSALPDLECDEHMVSTQMHAGKTKRQLVLDSLLTAKRTTENTDGFQERRNLQKVNGIPAPLHKEYRPPFMVSNGFGSRFLNYLAPQFAECNRYAARSVNEAGRPAYELEVHVREDVSSLPHCQSSRPATTAVFRIDAATERLLRFHVDMPHANTRNGYEMFVDDTVYTTMQFGPRTGILPLSVTASATNGKPGDQLLYSAHYGNCHRFVATSRIVADEEEKRP